MPTNRELSLAERFKPDDGFVIEGVTVTAI